MRGDPDEHAPEERRMTRRPAEGERTAIGGYHAQFTMAAELILDGLVARKLEAVRIADPDAGHLDDLQLIGPSRVDGYQVKSSRYGEPISLADLTRATERQPSLISQLANGWRDGQRMYPSKKFVPHLRTNRRPSTGDTVTSDPSGGARHFAAFLAQSWEPAHAGEAGLVGSGRWAQAWEEIRQAAQLSDSEFVAFVTDCSLEIGVGATAPVNGSAIAQQRANDIEELARYIESTVASPRQTVELSVERLLKELGWTTRIELTPNDFRIDASHYSPISRTERALRESLDTHRRGYVALVGTPGSGKSTLATAVTRSYPARSVRYYAFLPDAPDPASLRGESTTFLREVAVQLSDAGLRVGSLPGFDRHELLQHLHAQLLQAGQEYRDTGQRTILLIDGIDHIRRELRPVRSLVDDLPLPDGIPEGVTILIGSQHLNDLPSRIRHHLESVSGRVIEIEALDRDAVREIAQRTVAAPSDRLSTLLFERSAGHPLALQYLLQHAEEAGSSDDAYRLVAAAPAYGRDIEEQYVVYWDEVSGDSELVHLLGLLSRLRGAVDWTVLRERFPSELLDRFSRHTRHYFRREADAAPERWYFFHNSFRLFLVARTMGSAAGTNEGERDRAFHQELAGWCSAAPRGSSLRWDIVFHLAAAGDPGGLLAVGTQEFFRTQFLELRPPDDIEADLRLALREAVATRDLVALARLSLADSELSQRGFYLDESKLIAALLGVGRVDVALRRLRSGVRLRVGSATALELLPALRQVGEDSEASATFGLAEPLELIHADGPIELGAQHEDLDVLRTWAYEAVRYRDWGDVRAAIEGLELTAPTQWKMTNAEASEWLRRDLILEAAESLLSVGAKPQVMELIAEWSAHLPRGKRSWMALAVRVIRRFGAEDAPLVEELLEADRPLTLESDERVGLAEALFSIDGYQTFAEQLVDGLEQPGLADDLHVSDDFRKLDPRFRLNRLRSALGIPVDPDVAVPDAQNPRDEGRVRLERAVCRVATIHGAAWADRPFDGDLKDSAVRVLRVYYTDSRATRDWSQWYFATQQRSELLRRLIRGVAAFGDEAVSWLTRTVASEFRGSPEYWPAGTRRALLVDLDRVGADREWIIEQLDRVADEMNTGVDVSGRVEHALEQADAWLQVDERGRANAELQRAIEHTLGVGYEKDDQVENWIEWMREANAVDASRASDRIMWFARAVVAMRDGEGGRDYAAARELVEAACDISLHGALELADWFLFERIGIAHEMWETLVRQGLESGGDVVIAEHLFGDVLLSLARESESTVVEAILSRQANTSPSSVATAARSLAAAIDVGSLPTTRESWRRICAHALERHGVDPATVGFGPSALAAKVDENSSGEQLELDVVGSAEPTVLSVEEVRRRVGSVDAVLDLVARSSQSYFRWDSVLKPLIASANAAEVIRLAAGSSAIHYAAPVLKELALRMLELGDRQAAWVLGEQALAASSDRGWSKWWDGGSRLRAFEALIAIDQQRGRELLWNTLGADIGSGHLRPSVSSSDFTTLARLVGDEVPTLDLWEEIDDYAHALFGATGVPEIDVPSIGAETDQPAVDDSMLELILRLASHPVVPIRVGARRALAELVSARRPAVTRLFERLGELPLSHLEAVLVAAEAVAATETEANWMADSVATVVSTQDLSIRNLVHQVLRRVGAGMPTASGQRAALSPLYQMDLSQAAPGGEYLPDLADTVEVLEGNDELVAALAAAAGTEGENIVHRAAQLIGDVASEDRWLGLTEKQVLRVLDSASLRFPYRRRARELGRRVLFRIAAEIDDAGLLGARAAWRLLLRLAPSDPLLVRALPSVRPFEVPVDPPADWKTKEWAEAEIDIDSLMARKVGSYVVLAEITETKGLDWGAPTERREGLLVVPSTDVTEFDRDGLIFDSFFTAMTVEAYREFADSDDGALVVRQLGTGINAPDWIALNPGVGKALGWTPTSEGFMRWIDDQGSVMVETLWWRDGLVEHQPRGDGYAAEGCLVVAAPVALEQMQGTESLARAVAIERRLEGESPVARRQTVLRPR